MNKYFILVLSIWMVACSHSGPIRLYEGEARDQEEVAIIDLPREVDVVMLNNKEVTPPYNPAPRHQFHLLPGNYELGLRYEKLWMDDAQNHEVVKSKVVGIRIQARAGQTYRLEQTMPASLAVSRKFAQDIQLSLRLNNGQRFQGKLIAAPRQPTALLDTLFESEDRPLDHLKIWWQEASEAEKAAFRDYIVEQP